MFAVLRYCKDPTTSDEIWDDIKSDICTYLIKNKGAKKIDIILNNQKTKVIGLNCVSLNIYIRFYTCIISEETKDDNMLIIQKIDDSSNKDISIDNINISESISSYMNNVPENFYNIIV